MAGANPTFASCWTQLGLVIKQVNDLELTGSSATPNMYAMEDAFVVGMDGEYTPSMLNYFRGVRAAVSAKLAPAVLRSQVFRPAFVEMGRKIGIPEATKKSDLALLKRIRKYMVDNSQTLNSRDMTLDVTLADTGTGEGHMDRLIVDKDGEPLECTGAEARVAECIRDQNQVAEHAEVFEVRGANKARDNLDWEGSGIRKEITAVNAATSQQYVVNPSFETNGASADDSAPSAISSIEGWDGVAAASYKLRDDSTANNVYRGYPGEPSTLWSVEYDANDTLTQVIQAEKPGTVFNPDIPYYCQIAWQRVGAATGNLTLHFGAVSATVALATGTAAQWNILKIAVGANNWYQQFGEADMDIKVVVDTLATASVIVDDLIVAPYVNIDGTWYVVVGGGTGATGPVSFLKGDYFSWADTDGGTRATLSYWLWQAYGKDGWLPTATGGAETIADPA